MRLDLFSKDDSVLLLGEGNFSFSVCLRRHRLPIGITSTCFQSEPRSQQEVQNIDYLKANDVRVFFNVDATKLHENAHFDDVKFSKIIFNFPHVGGKMKIHLNRELLRNFFLSAGHVLANNGLVLVSLCQGQGGTPADSPQRHWADTWQITEMAAHGDFILTNVEPFLKENFPEYNCVGYRSQNVGFHLDGALVHVFSKKPFDFLPEGHLGPKIYTDLHQRNPIFNPDSGISYLLKILIESLNEPEVEVVEMSAQIKQEVDQSLCSDPINDFPALFKLSRSENLKKLILYPSMYFRNSGSNFLTDCPVDFKFTISGKDLRAKIAKFLNKLIEIFREKGSVISDENAMTYKNTETGNDVRAVEFYEFQCTEYCIVNAQSLCMYFFRVGWRQIWADHTITSGGIPSLKPVLLYPSRYEFDITLRYTKPFSDEDLFRTLWLGCGLLIDEVKFLSEYTSDKWSSKCYRISYKSLDRPMYKKRVVEIHSSLGRMLEAELDVTIG